MTKFMLVAGVAALAIVSPALAQGQGGGKDKGGPSAKAERGGGNAGSGHGGHHARKADRGKGGGEMRGQRKAEQRDARSDKGNKPVRADRGDRRDDRAVIRTVDVGRDRDIRIVRNDRDRFVPGWNENGLRRGFVDGCPPGLAKKGNGCMPPGQAKKLVGTRLSAALSNNMLDGPFRQWYRDNDDFYYRGDGDYIYRVRREGGLIDALFPSFDRDYYYYPVGMNYPMDYNYYNVPYQYSSFYPDSRDNWYRYGDGAIYQVNPSNGLIQGIAALLAGDLSVGQPLPNSYYAYNVPMSYRDRYYDTDRDWYRYNDGYIYRVDPTTQLVTAVINALV